MAQLPCHEDPAYFAKCLRALLSIEEERLLDARYREASRAMWRRVAETMPEMTIAAVMQRWAQEIAEMPLAEQCLAGQDKLAVLSGLGFAHAQTLVAEALALAERLGEQADRVDLPTRRGRRPQRVG